MGNGKKTKQGQGSSGGRTRAAGKQKNGRYRLKDPRKLIRLIPLIGIPILLIAMVVMINKARLREGLGGAMSSLGTLLLPTPAPEAMQTSAVVEGVDVTGMTRTEAEAQIKPEATSLLASIDLLLTQGETQLRMTSAFIGATTNMEQILDAIYTKGQSGAFTLQLTADKDIILERLAAVEKDIGSPAQEPYITPRLNENNVQRFDDIFPGKDGTALDMEATAQRVLDKLAARELQGEFEPVLRNVSPEMSVEFLEANHKRISTFTTRFRDSSTETIANRVFNITKAAEIINCAVVQPGAEWSFNDYVGLRTVEGGWREANGISGGKEYTLQAGGGICQVSTTLYNALLLGNIQVTDRKAHSIPSDYVDKGLDATVDSGGIDLKFRNDTGAPLYIFAYIKPDSESKRYSTITVSLYGKPLPEGVSYRVYSTIAEIKEKTDTKFTYSDKVPEGYEMTTVTRHDGYEAEVYREKNDNGEVTTELLYTDKYRGNVAEIIIGTGDPATVQPPEGASRTGNTSSEAG